MTHHQRDIHGGHPHEHGPGCGHTAIRHGDHIDYLDEGHLHHQQGGRVEEHRIEVSEKNPDRCTPEHECAHHPGREGHRHGEAETREREHAHERIPHGDHVDYLHEGRLHRHHGDHCDDHGPVEVVSQA